jgi:ATP-binding cassette subfamily F protein uup
MSFHDYVGGYEDYLLYKTKQQVTPSIVKAPETVARPTISRAKLSYNEQRELKALPQKIAEIENYISGLQQTMLSKNFYQQSAEEISGFKQNLSDQEAALAELYVRWEVLESKEA